MLQAMYDGVSGIQSQEQNMDVIGNNIANIDTTAFKTSDITFADQLSQTMAAASPSSATSGGTNPEQVGMGVSIGSISLDNSQGTLTATGTPTDLAIQGNGYFMVSNSNGGVNYTRDGNFAVNSSGQLVDDDTGQFVQGYSATAAGTINTSGGVSQLSIPVGTGTAAQATSNVTFAGNLSADAVPPVAPSTTPNYTQNVTVYDSLGDAHNLTISFTRATTGTPPTTTNQWNYSVTSTNPDLEAQVAASAGPPAVAPVNEGSVTFDGNGAIIPADTTGTIQLTPTVGSTTPQTITPNFGALTQLSGSSTVTPQSQDGYPTGTLQSFSVDQNGVITGAFSNGLTRSIGQIAMANFSNPGGLSSVGSNEFQTTVSSGTATIGVPNATGMGAIQAGYLEQSNVDLSSQFTNMIVAQRAYEANTKMVTTVDTMLGDIMQMVQ